MVATAPTRHATPEVPKLATRAPSWRLRRNWRGWRQITAPRPTLGRTPARFL